MKRTAGLIMLLAAIFLVSWSAVAEGECPSNDPALGIIFLETKTEAKEVITADIGDVAAKPAGPLLREDFVRPLAAAGSPREEGLYYMMADDGLEPGSIYLERLSTNYIRSPTAA